MIGALLSNTPAAVLKASGVAGDSGTALQDGSSGREPEPDGSSLASARAESRRTSSGPLLTPQAVLALQETEETEETPDRGRASADAAGADGSSGAEVDPAVSRSAAPAPQVDPATASSAGAGDEEGDADGDGLDEAEEKQVDKLKQRDLEVRAHEQAHARTGGAYAGAPSYTFQQGPDGKRYAVGGEVSIDTSGERTPEATVRKMQIVIRAATAPADPSSQDLKVAQQARSQLAEAQAELRQTKTDEQSGVSEDGERAAQTPGSSSASSETAADGGATSSSAGESDSVAGSRSREAGDKANAAYRSALQRADDAQAIFSAVIS